MNDNAFSHILKAVPIAGFSFDKSPLLSELFDIFNDLPSDILPIYLETMVDIRISMMRQLPYFTTPSPENAQFKVLLKSLCKISQEKLYDAILAASIITNVNPNEIVRLSQISITKTEIDLVLLTLNSIYNPEPTVVFRPNGEISVIETRPYIPETFYRYFISRDLFFASFPEPIKQHKLEKVTPKNLFKDIINAPGFFTDDLSSGFNSRNGLPDVPCYNEIDSTPPIIIWVSFLKFNRPNAGYKDSCQHDDRNCLTYHQKNMADGRKSLVYQPDGRILISDLKDHVPLIFECNENQCLCSREKCPNRVVQNRWKWKLSVIRTKRPFGWCVRTFEFIPKGSFVCELLGRIITSQDEFEAAIKIGGSSLYNLDAFHVPVDSMLIIDARAHGNIASYMEPSMTPNLVPISVCNGDTLSFHKIAFFAIRDIFPNEEISFHPNYAFDWQKQIMLLEKEKGFCKPIKVKDKDKSAEEAATSLNEVEAATKKRGKRKKKP